MANLIILIGLPGSGKSSLAKQLIAEHPEQLLISTDAIRAQLFGDEATQGPWLWVWRKVRQEFCSAVLVINQERSRVAIYDATNTRRRNRRQVFALAREAGFTHITGLWLDTPLPVCLKRNQQRDRQVPEPVILQMHRQLVDAPPRLSEGFDRLIYVEGSTGIAIVSQAKTESPYP